MMTMRSCNNIWSRLITVSTFGNWNPWIYNNVIILPKMWFICTCPYHVIHWLGESIHLSSVVLCQMGPYWDLWDIISSLEFRWYVHIYSSQTSKPSILFYLQCVHTYQQWFNCWFIWRDTLKVPSKFHNSKLAVQSVLLYSGLIWNICYHVPWSVHTWLPNSDGKWDRGQTVVNQSSKSAFRSFCDYCCIATTTTTT